MKKGLVFYRLRQEYGGAGKVRVRAHFALQCCLLLMRNKADVIAHFLIKFDRSILLSHFL